MRKWGACLLLFLSGCGGERELFCEGVVKQVSEDSTNYKIEFCDGSECRLYKYGIRERGVPSGRISVWYLPEEEEFDMQYEEPAPTCLDSPSGPSGKGTEPW